MSSACPYCEVSLEPPPQKNRKCPSCRQQIVVRTERETGEKQLLTQEDGDRLDAQRKANAARNKVMRRISWLGVTDQDFDTRESQLAEQWGTEPTPGDVFWSIANEKITELKSQPHVMSQLYFQMGAQLKEEGRSAVQMQRQAHEVTLRSSMKTGAEFDPENQRAVILANACCHECRKLDGQVFTFEEALNTMPLPPKSCTQDWCNCSWSVTYLE